jgi:hypothetical protein
VEDAGRRQQLAEIAMSDEVWEAKGCRTLLNRFVESRRKKAVRRSLQQEIEAAEKGRNEAEVMRLLSEKQKLAARRVGPRAPVAPER